MDWAEVRTLAASGFSQHEIARRLGINRRTVKRLIESGDEVVVTYESTRTDGSHFGNTEVLTFDGDKITQVEVYFGWDLE